MYNYRPARAVFGCVLHLPVWTLYNCSCALPPQAAPAAQSTTGGFWGFDDSMVYAQTVANGDSGPEATVKLELQLDPSDCRDYILVPFQSAAR